MEQALIKGAVLVALASIVVLAAIPTPHGVIEVKPIIENPRWQLPPAPLVVQLPKDPRVLPDGMTEALPLGIIELNASDAPPQLRSKERPIFWREREDGSAEYVDVPAHLEEELLAQALAFSERLPLN